jgi:hypothetical protein
MPQVPGGFIAGNTDAMQEYGPLGPDPTVLGDPARLNSRMLYGGFELVGADAAATEQLAAYIAAANAGFETLGRRARDAGREYLTTEEAVTASFTVAADPAAAGATP